MTPQSEIPELNLLFSKYFIPLSRLKGTVASLKSLTRWTVRSELLTEGDLYEQIEKLPIPEHIHELLMFKLEE